MTSTALFGRLRVTARSFRDRRLDGSVQQPRSIIVAMDLGLRSDPNMHRAHSGPSECG
jgi:hypothetical protein